MEIHDAMQQYAWLDDILQELPESVLSRIKVRAYKPSEIMIEHCEANYYTYILLSGVCCTRQRLETGELMVLRKATAGDVVGFSGIYETSNAFSAHICARSQVVAALLPRPLVKECLGKYPAFTSKVTQRVISRLNSLVTLLSECNNYPTFLGLITYLLYNYLFYSKVYPDSYSGPVYIMETRKNIAAFLGVDVRSVQRMLARLKKAELISIQAKRILINQAQFRALEKAKADCLEKILQ